LQDISTRRKQEISQLEELGIRGEDFSTLARKYVDLMTGSSNVAKPSILANETSQKKITDEREHDAYVDTLEKRLHHVMEESELLKRQHVEEMEKLMEKHTSEHERDRRRIDRLEKQFDSYRKIEQEFLLRTGSDFFGPQGLQTILSLSKDSAASSELIDGLHVNKTPLQTCLELLKSNLKAELTQTQSNIFASEKQLLMEKIQSLQSALTAKETLIISLQAEVSSLRGLHNDVSLLEQEAVEIKSKFIDDLKYASTSSVVRIPVEKLSSSSAFSKMQTYFPNVLNVWSTILNHMNNLQRSHQIFSSQITDLNEELLLIKNQHAHDNTVHMQNTTEYKNYIANSSAERKKLEAMIQELQVKVNRFQSIELELSERISRYKQRVQRAKDIFASYKTNLKRLEERNRELEGIVTEKIRLLGLHEQREADLVEANDRCLEMISEKDKMIAKLKLEKGYEKVHDTPTTPKSNPIILSPYRAFSEKSIDISIDSPYFKPRNE
jgi:myosin heavy subunit